MWANRTLGLVTRRRGELIDGLVDFAHRASSALAAPKGTRGTWFHAAVLVASRAPRAVGVAPASGTSTVRTHQGQRTLVVVCARRPTNSTAAVLVASALVVSGAGRAETPGAHESARAVFVRVAGTVARLAGLASSASADVLQASIAVAS